MAKNDKSFTLKSVLKSIRQSVRNFVLRLLPDSVVIFVLRRLISVPDPLPDLTVEIASSREDLERAYMLLHDCYVATGLMDRDPSGLRVNHFTFMPSTTTIVAKIGTRVVGTLSLIKDSPSGLPSDSDFSEENDKLRLEGHLLVEVSALAIDREYTKRSHVVSLYLMKYLQHYTTFYMGCTTVSCVVHPRARLFYKAFWNFNASPKVVEYKSVKGALGMHMFGQITDRHVGALNRSFPRADRKNPMDFLFRSDACLRYPARKIQHFLDPIYTPELLKYFLLERTDASLRMTFEELIAIYMAYEPFFPDLDKISVFDGFSKRLNVARTFRFPAKIPATITSSHGIVVNGYIADLSQNGGFFATEEPFIIGDNYTVRFDLGFQAFSVEATARWRNRRRRNRQTAGVGFSFFTPQYGVLRLLRQTHLKSSAFELSNRRDIA